MRRCQIGLGWSEAMQLITDFEADAARRLPANVYAYFAGGAGDEQTLGENSAAWRRWWLRPRAMVDVGTVQTEVNVLGTRWQFPCAIAPMAAQRLLHEDGELAMVRAAAAAGVPYCLSTRATADVADVCAAGGPHAMVWFQLYVQVDRAATEAAVRHAVAAGVQALVLTVDLPVAGRRERERALPGIELPDGVRLATHTGQPSGSTTKPLGGWDPSLTWDDIGWLREIGGGLPVLLKGVLTAEDASLAIAHGASGVIVSNHGGRQLDGVVPTAHALPEIAAAVDGAIPVLVDGGIRDGGDIVRALALGAEAVMLGRPAAWALTVGGQPSVSELIGALQADTERSLALCGCPSPESVSRGHVTRAS